MGLDAWGFVWRVRIDRSKGGVRCCVNADKGCRLDEGLPAQIGLGERSGGETGKRGVEVVQRGIGFGVEVGSVRVEVPVIVLVPSVGSQVGVIGLPLGEMVVDQRPHRGEQDEQRAQRDWAESGKYAIHGC